MTLLASFLGLATILASQQSGVGSEPEYVLPEGLEVTTWASSPHLFNPTAIDVDARGRVWVSEGVNYRKWDGRNPGREHAEGERIVILEDKNGDGLCDHGRVFVQDPDLTTPLGIAVIGERVFVSCSPNLFVYTDSDGDDLPDKRETFLTGFGGENHDHGLHSVVAGPDGRLYFNVGNAGPHLVQDRSGWNLRSGSIYNGGGPRIADNKPGLLSDDGYAWTGGLILRMSGTGSGLEVLAHNFRNNYEVALDSFGNLFQSDNDDDGNQSCRTLWCMEGGNYGYLSEDGTRTWQFDRRPGQSIQTAHWHQDDPGVAPPGTINGAGGPTGVAIYEGHLLAPWIDGAVLNADAGAGVVYAHFPRGKGAGFELEKSELIRALPTEDSKGSQWFRPSDVAVGVDGAVFVADWFDPAVGGHWAGDRKAHGSILRIAPKENLPMVPPIDMSEERGALAALTSPAVNVRELGRQRLSLPGAAQVAALRRVFDNEGDPRVQARALWILVGAHGDEEYARKALEGADADLRVVAVRALAQAAGGTLPLQVQRKLVRDPSPAVRRELLLQLREVPFTECSDLLVALCEQHTAGDRAYLEAVGIAARDREELLFSELIADQSKSPSSWSEAFAEIAWRLHPASAQPAFLTRALDEKLALALRRRAADALAFIETREAAEAMLTLAQVGPAELRELAEFWVRHRDTNTWQSFSLLEQLEKRGLQDAQLAFESEVIREGTVKIDLELGEARRLWLVADDAGNGNGCDWADWVAPRFTAGERVVPLREIGWSEASSQWGSVAFGSNAAGGPLRIGERQFGEDSIGTHANSQIAFDIPEGLTHFRCEAGVDLGGTSQADGAVTSVRFRVYLEHPVQPDDTPILVRHVLDSELPLEERARVASELALHPTGALHLIRMAKRGDLTPELETTVAAVIHRNPDLSIRALASEHFARPGEEERPFPSLAELTSLQGDAHRGGEIFFAERALCSSCHVIRRDGVPRGKEIGPELTGIREKFGSQELFDSILNPSAAIAFGYDTWLLETEDGLLHSGFLLADAEQIVLKDSQGVRKVLDSKDVVARTKQTSSTMPEGVALGLSAQELADLVAFLREEPQPEPRFGARVPLFNGKDLTGWTHHLTDPSVAASRVWSIEDGILICKGSPIGYLRTESEYTSFRLTLEWRFPADKQPGNSGVLLRRTGEDKVWPKSIEAQLLHRDAGDIFNIGDFDMETAPLRTSGRRTSRMQPSSEKPIGEWNRYEILLHGGRLELRVNGVLQNEASWCEEVSGNICLQSEGVEIHFRNISIEEIEN